MESHGHLAVFLKLSHRLLQYTVHWKINALLMWQQGNSQRKVFSSSWIDRKRANTGLMHIFPRLVISKPEVFCYIAGWDMKACKWEFSSTSGTVTIPQCVEKESWNNNDGGHCPVGGVKVPSILGPQVTTNRGTYTCRIDSSREVIAFCSDACTDNVTNLTFVRALEEDHAWLCNFRCCLNMITEYCFVSGFVAWKWYRRNMTGLLISRGKQWQVRKHIHALMLS